MIGVPGGIFLGSLKLRKRLKKDMLNNPIDFETFVLPKLPLNISFVRNIIALGIVISISVITIMFVFAGYGIACLA